MEEKEKTEENEQRFAYAREYLAKEAELQKIFGSILAVKDKVAELSIEVDSEKCVPKTDLNERARTRKENVEWDQAVAHRVWCCGPETEGSQCGCKTTKRKSKDPQSQPVVEGNNTLVAAPRKYDRFQAAEAHLPDGVVKEEIRELHAATLAECSGRLAPGWRQQRTGSQIK